MGKGRARARCSLFTGVDRRLVGLVCVREALLVLVVIRRDDARHARETLGRLGPTSATSTKQPLNNQHHDSRTHSAPPLLPSLAEFQTETGMGCLVNKREVSNSLIQDEPATAGDMVLNISSLED
jgi:hypothetical protein